MDYFLPKQTKSEIFMILGSGFSFLGNHVGIKILWVFSSALTFFFNLS